MRHLIWTTAWMMILGKFAFGVSQEYVPIYEKALGHSLAGANVMNDSLYSNPASSTFSNVYSIDGSYAPPKTFAVSILDTKTSSIGGGLGYFRTGIANTEDLLQAVRLTLGGRVTDTLGVGVTGKMLWTPNNRHNGVDVGAFYNLGTLQFGAVTHNAFGENAGMNQFREYSVGGRINWQQAMFFSVAAQGKVDDGEPEQYSMGVEYVSPYFFSLKGGFRRRPYTNPESFWSMGASFNSPKLGLHYAVEIPQQDSSETEHLLGATLLF